MNEKRFWELIEKTGHIAPKGLEAYIGDLEAEQDALLDKDDLADVLAGYDVPQDKQNLLYEALDEINAVPELVELGQIMARDAVRALNRCTAIGFFQPKPICLEGFAKDAFGFIFLLRCIAEGRKALRQRGVPESFDEDIPERMLRRQIKKFVETDDINFDDYPWDVNFYCCDIFLIDRFYFIPYMWESTPEAWRSERTGEVKAVWKAGVRVRNDGQLDGVNKVFDSDPFTTVYEETDDAITANPVSPDGLILKETVTLDKKDWRKVLKEGDYLLALHIPGGEGYTPERVKNSCEKALGFYRKYFPEYNYVGFWSESWLYDAALGRILGPERNISRVQKQFYCYPTMEGDDMARREVLHDPNADYRKMAPKTALEKGMFDTWDKGERFHTTGMFLLREEVAEVGSAPYWKEV